MMNIQRNDALNSTALLAVYGLTYTNEMCVYIRRYIAYNVKCIFGNNLTYNSFIRNT